MITRRPLNNQQNRYSALCDNTWNEIRLRYFYTFTHLSNNISANKAEWKNRCANYSNINGINLLKSVGSHLCIATDKLVRTLTILNNHRTNTANNLNLDIDNKRIRPVTTVRNSSIMRFDFKSS